MATNDKRVGEVWLCFEGTKERPVLVLSGSIAKFDIDVNVSRITSKPPRNEFDVKLNYWKRRVKKTVSRTIF